MPEQQPQNVVSEAEDAFHGEFDLQKAIAEAKPGVHTWRQQGPQLICASCAHHHAQYVGMTKRLSGINEKGEPILTDVNLA